MDKSRNGSDTRNTNCTREALHRVAREMFQRLICHVENKKNRGVVWEISRATSRSDGVSREEAACCENDGVVQQHLISSVTFRWIESHSVDEWELENIWDNVCVHQLEDIGQKTNCECRTVSYGGPKNIQVAMAETANIVLLRTIFDWSRLDGNVWSQQIVWSGNFADCHRLLQLLEDNSNSIKLRGERFDLHPHLREQYIARHRSHPLATAVAAIGSSPTVMVTDELLGTDDGEGDTLLCVICQETLSVGEDNAKQLPCNHLFHWNCILKWLYLKLECPLCRNEFQRHCSGE